MDFKLIFGFKLKTNHLKKVHHLLLFLVLCNTMLAQIVGPSHFSRGNAKFDSKDFIGAIADYSLAIEQNSRFAEAYSNRGLCKDNLMDYKGAISDFSKAIEINPKYASAYFNRGVTRYKLKDYIGTIADYNMALKLNPNMPNVYSNRGLAKSGLQDYAGAVQDYDVAIKKNPKSSKAYINRGAAKFKLKDAVGAINDFSKSIELDPKNDVAYSNRGRAKFSINDFAGAIADYKQAIDINPAYGDMKISNDSLKNAGLEDNSRLAKSKKLNLSANSNQIMKITTLSSGIGVRSNLIVSSFENTKIMELDPKFYEGYHFRKVYIDNSQDFKLVCEKLDKQIDKIKTDPKLYFERGVAKGKMLDFKAAILDFDKAIELEPNNEEYYFSRGIACMHHLYQAAIRDFTKVLEMNPKRIDALVFRANAKVYLEDYAGGIIDYTAATLINPDYAILYNNRAVAYIELEQKDLACSDFSKSGELGYAAAYTAIRQYCQESSEIKKKPHSPAPKFFQKK